MSSGDSERSGETPTPQEDCVADLGRACVTDPLSLATGPAPDMLDTLDAEIATVSTHVAGLAELRDSWQQQLATLAATLDELDTLRDKRSTPGSARKC